MRLSFLFEFLKIFLPQKQQLAHVHDSAVLLQTIFFWTLLVRHILQYYDSNPHMRPKPPPKILEDCSTPESMVELSEQQQSQIHEIFDLFDTDGGGSIDSHELDAAMFALGFQPSGRRMGSSFQKKRQGLSETLLDRIDSDGSRSISLPEFTSLMKGELMGRGPLEEIWAAFSVLSKAETLGSGWVAPPVSKTEYGEEWGHVTLDGLRRACKEFDVRMSEKELAFMLKEADVDGSMTVDRAEFMRIMDNSPWF
jgi:Ca2+-binding EF-hand superfamily protein